MPDVGERNERILPLQIYENERKKVSEVLTEAAARIIREEPRFRGIKQFKNRRAVLTSPILYSGEMGYVSGVLESGAGSETVGALEFGVGSETAGTLEFGSGGETAGILGLGSDGETAEVLELGSGGENVEALEEETARFVGVKHAAAFCSSTAAMHMAVRLAAEKVYGEIDWGGYSNGISRSSIYEKSSMSESGIYVKGSALSGRRVFCSDLTSSAMVNPVLYEGGEPVFIDASPWDWGMDPEVLELAFDRYPDVKIVIMAHIYGFPGQIRRVKEICEKHGALLIEDACESFGAAIEGRQTGSFGDYGVLSFGNGQIITGTGGGMILTNDPYDCQKARRLELQSKQSASGGRYDKWKYCSQMGDIAAGVIRGQMKHLDELIAKKKEIYERYEECFSEDLVLLNPIGKGVEPNYRTSCMTVESSILFQETRSEREYEYKSRHGTAAPMEILDALEAFGVEGRPIWKPMHLQPVFQNYDQITLDGSRREYEKAKRDDFWVRSNESADIFRKGLCLPSDIRMTEEEQERVIEIVSSCFNGREMDRELCGAI